MNIWFVLTIRPFLIQWTLIYVVEYTIYLFYSNVNPKGKLHFMLISTKQYISKYII